MGQALLTDGLRRRLGCLEYLQVELKKLDRQINEIAAQERYRDEISSLRCLNGAGTLTALAVRCEVGDFGRFPTARSFMGFMGLVPSEHSSGNTIRRGSITKTGNSSLRRLLVESSWKFVSREKNSAALHKKREGLDHRLVQHGKKASRRLHNRYHRLCKHSLAVSLFNSLIGYPTPFPSPDQHPTLPKGHSKQPRRTHSSHERNQLLDASHSRGLRQEDLPQGIDLLLGNREDRNGYIQ
ncbi:MAG: IS110 family transposase [Spirochaetaceae bacterium]|nr:MAG: IS110 family transposase [Spirochaetaceae bacterium]